MFAHGDLVHLNLIRHQNYDVVEIGFHIIHIAHQIQELQYVHIRQFEAVAIMSGTLTTFNHAPNRTVEERMDGIIEEIKRS